MYKFSYAEILDDSGNEARGRERAALDRAIELLSVAEVNGARSQEASTALLQVQRLWNFLIADLANPQNGLAEQLRADLISIGIWVMKEADRILNDQQQSFTALIDVNKTIRDGLS